MTDPYTLPGEDPDSDIEANFKPGGFHPVHIGDRFNRDQYIIENKYHFDCSGSTWLAYQNTTVNNRYLVAIKFYVAWRSTGANSRSVDLKFLQKPELKSKPEFFQIIQDEFIVTGPNGTHSCAVFDAPGPTLRDVMERYHLGYQTFLPISFASQVSIQISDAIAYLHSHGICHGGLQPSNILCYIPGLGSLGPEQRTNYISSPSFVNLPESILRSPQGYHFPRQRTQDCRWSHSAILEVLGHPQVKITDFENARYSNETGKPINIASHSVLFKAPETQLNLHLTDKSDIWSLGTIFPLLFGLGCLFHIYYLTEDEPGTEEDTLLDICLAYRNDPHRDSFWDKWSGKGNYFDEKGSLLQQWELQLQEDQEFKSPVLYTIQERLNNPEIIPSSDYHRRLMNLDEHAKFKQLMLRVLALRPGHRIQAREVAYELRQIWPYGSLSLDMEFEMNVSRA